MDETAADCDALCLDTLLKLSGLFVPGPEGSLRFDGERPSADWHAHGWFRKSLSTLVRGNLVVVKIYKRRWRRIGTSMTCHSRPPNDLVLVRFCTFIVTLRILGWLTSARGFHHRAELMPDLIEAGSDRSVQRWSARAQRNAPQLEQAVRQTALALRRVEPRPEEDLFRRGRAPPVGLSSRRWHNEASTTALWRALDMLFVAAKQLSWSVPLLLAEARRRWLTEDDIFPF